VTIPRLKATGSRGSWYAEVAGEKLPCVHSPNMRGSMYRAFWPDDQPHHDLLSAIRDAGKVIVRKSTRNDDDSGWMSNGYIGVFSVKNAQVEGDQLTFELVERLADLNR
jgi:hypothetical protein